MAETRANKKKKNKGPLQNDVPLDERIAALVDAVWDGASTVPEMMRVLPGWSRPTARRVLRECERIGVLCRTHGAMRVDTPGRPSDMWQLA